MMISSLPTECLLETLRYHLLGVRVWADHEELQEHIDSHFMGRFKELMIDVAKPLLRELLLESVDRESSYRKNGTFYAFVDFPVPETITIHDKRVEVNGRHLIIVEPWQRGDYSRVFSDGRDIIIVLDQYEFIPFEQVKQDRNFYLPSCPDDAYIRYSIANGEYIVYWCNLSAEVAVKYVNMAVLNNFIEYPGHFVRAWLKLHCEGRWAVGLLKRLFERNSYIIGDMIADIINCDNVELLSELWSDGSDFIRKLIEDMIPIFGYPRTVDWFINTIEPNDPFDFHADKLILTGNIQILNRVLEKYPFTNILPPSFRESLPSLHGITEKTYRDYLSFFTRRGHRFDPEMVSRIAINHGFYGICRNISEGSHRSQDDPS